MKNFDTFTTVRKSHRKWPVTWLRPDFWPWRKFLITRVHDFPSWRQNTNVYERIITLYLQIEAQCVWGYNIGLRTTTEKLSSKYTQRMTFIGGYPWWMWATRSHSSAVRILSRNIRSRALSNARMYKVDSVRKYLGDTRKQEGSVTLMDGRNQVHCVLTRKPRRGYSSMLSIDRQRWRLQCWLNVLMEECERKV